MPFFVYRDEKIRQIILSEGAKIVQKGEKCREENCDLTKSNRNDIIKRMRKDMPVLCLLQRTSSFYAEKKAESRDHGRVSVYKH